MNKRLQQLVLGTLTAVSLIAWSVSACTCPHMQVVITPAVPPCHHQTTMPDSDYHEMTPAENTCDYLVADDDCVCADVAQKTIAKSGAVKLNRHVTLATPDLPRFTARARVQQPVKAGFVRPSYLSAYFSDLSPSRGPPRL